MLHLIVFMNNAKNMLYGHNFVNDTLIVCILMQFDLYDHHVVQKILGLSTRPWILQLIPVCYGHAIFCHYISG
jgi:hypothetical protein